MKIKRLILITLGVLILISIFVAVSILTNSKPKTDTIRDGFNPYGTQANSQGTEKNNEPNPNNNSEHNEESNVQNESINNPQENSKEAIANIILASGTKIIDKTGDWIPTGNPEDNPSPYPVHFIDIKEVDIGIDEDYLYVKAIFNSKWPEKDSDWPSYDGDPILDNSLSIAIDSDNDPKTGCRADGGTEMSLDIGGSRIITGGNPPGTYNHYKINPTGIEDPEEKRYGNFYVFDERIMGGPGFDYFINIYPLSNLNLTKDQVVSLKIKAEASSKKYHHGAVDDMNWFNGPTESKLVIRLGENKTIYFNS